MLTSEGLVVPHARHCTAGRPPFTRRGGSPLVGQILVPALATLGPESDKIVGVRVELPEWLRARVRGQSWVAASDGPLELRVPTASESRAV